MFKQNVVRYPHFANVMKWRRPGKVLNIRIIHDVCIRRFVSDMLSEGLYIAAGSSDVAACSGSRVSVMLAIVSSIASCIVSCSLVFSFSSRSSYQKSRNDNKEKFEV